MEKLCAGDRILFHTKWNEVVIKEGKVLEVVDDVFIKLEDPIESWYRIDEITVLYHFK